MTDTDTRAALSNLLDVAICRRCDRSDSIATADRDEIDAAITAHVEAEVARRLAVAPSVEEAIRAHDEAAQAEGAALALHRLPTGGDETYAAYTRAVEATEDAWSDLDHAIAADRERAVCEATKPRITSTTGVVPVVADAEGRMLGGRREGRDTIYDQVKMLVGAKARLAPDEARRLVDAYGCDAAMHGALGATGDTRTALLRALGGVEA